MGANRGADLTAPDGARFNGINAFIKVPHTDRLNLGKQDWSASVWVHTDAELTDVLGDVLSKYDPTTRTGVMLSIMNYAGVTSATVQLPQHFLRHRCRSVGQSVDGLRPPGKFPICDGYGRLRRTAFLPEPTRKAKKEAGRVYRYDGGTAWTDCGFPEKANGVGALAVYQGKLYAGQHPLQCGGVSDGQISQLAARRQGLSLRWRATMDRLRQAGRGQRGVRHGQSLAGDSMPHHCIKTARDLYRYDVEQQWTCCGNPGRRIQPLAVYNGALYAGSYDQGHFMRYDGQTNWTDLGQVPETTQVYSFAVYEGRLHLCNWPSGSVFVYDVDENQWTSVGRLGSEQEVIGRSSVQWEAVWRHASLGGPSFVLMAQTNGL